MFVAASLKSYWDLPLEEACEQAGEAGFDKIELWLDEEQGPLRPSEIVKSPEAFVARIRELTRLTPIGLQVERDLSPDTMRGLAKASKLLRFAQITIPASPVGTPFNEEVDRLRALVAAASPEGTRVSIKTVTGSLTEDPLTATSLCETIRGLGVTLDPSFYMTGPTRGSDYDVLLKHVCHVHLRDTSPTVLQTSVGSGEMDYSRLVNRLQRSPLAPALSVDLLPSETDIESRPLEMRKLRMLLETLL